MAVSRLDSQGANIRATNAAKAVGRISKVDSILTRLAPISHPDQLTGQMLDRIVAADPALGQRVPLAVAAYCTMNKLPIPGSLAEAVQSLTYSTVRRIIQIVGFDSLLGELAHRIELNPKLLLAQAVATGTCASELAAKCGEDRDVAFATGFFANVGVPVLAYSEKGYVGLASAVIGESTPLHVAERQTLFCTHPEAGYCLLTDYGFHEDLCAGARFHADVTSIKIIQIARVAEQFAHQLGFDGGFAIIPEALDPGCLGEFGCKESDIPSLCETINLWSSTASRILV